VKSVLIMFQLCLKNRVVKPSGPGALSSGIENKAVLISSLVTGWEMAEIDASDMVLGKYWEMSLLRL